MPLDRERIIVLRRFVYKDSDYIIRGLNTHGSKVSFLAPGAVKSRKRFGGGVLEPTHFIEVIFQSPQKSKNGLRLIKEARIIKEFQGLRRNYDLLQLSLSILGLMDHVGQEGDSLGEDLFNLLGHSLSYLSERELLSLPLFRLHFHLKFLYQQGVLALESWMTPFLKTVLSEHHQLFSMAEEQGSVWIINRLMELEKLSLAYRETGTTHN